ncbi:hypothetical protein SDC9_181621 [bioreactor metagenome]|uniref:Uncharacterized protein n=1 Tax=bioreactor metagenome TaxID=1076179 RepID=A0A645H556_9ZZZZ
MSHSALRTVRTCSAKLLLINLLMSYRLYHIGTGNKHVAFLFHHEDEIGQSGRVARSAGTRA